MTLSETTISACEDLTLILDSEVTELQLTVLRASALQNQRQTSLIYLERY